MRKAFSYIAVLMENITLSRKLSAPEFYEFGDEKNAAAYIWYAITNNKLLMLRCDVWSPYNAVNFLTK